LNGTTRWQIYGGPSAEPALGPVAYPHRVSAMPNPLAPIAHHWLDATHVSFGVVTGGVYGQRWKLETSAFNGREPDENRKDFDFGALDSVSGRAWFLPTTNVALQVSAGHLKGAEAGEGTGPRATWVVPRRRRFIDCCKSAPHRDRVGAQLGSGRGIAPSPRDECDARRSAHVVRPAGSG
jgi:hypothetical protein